MSDVRYLFAKSKSPLPAKRLFDDERRTGARGVEPRKDSPSKRAVPDGQRLMGQLSKRHLEKSQLRRELALYNRQILLSLLRKVFFLMVVVLLFNMLATEGSQTLVVANIILGLTLLDLPLGSVLSMQESTGWVDGGYVYPIELPERYCSALISILWLATSAEEAVWQYTKRSSGWVQLMLL
jgi:hypothetical protein